MRGTALDHELQSPTFEFIDDRVKREFAPNDFFPAL